MVYELFKKTSKFWFKTYIDYDREKNVFYYNFFFEDCKFVLKIALTSNDNLNNVGDKDDMTSEDDINLKFEKFDITKYVYLQYYD